MTRDAPAAEEPVPADPSAILSTLGKVLALATSPAAKEEVLRACSEAVRTELDFDRVALYVHRPGSAVLQPAVVSGWDCAAPLRPHLRQDECLETRAVIAGRAIVLRPDGEELLSDLDRRRNRQLARSSCAFVPIRAGGRVLGEIVADRSPTGRPIRAGDVEGLELLCAPLGLFLESRDLAEMSETKVQGLLALQRISREMTSTLESGELLRTVVAEARRLSGAEGGVLYLLDSEGETLKLEAWTGTAPPPGRERIPLGYGIPGWVARSGTPLRAADHGGTAAGVSYATRRSHLAVPLLSEGSVVGVLAVEGSREEAFTEVHEEILGIFAAQAAKAIEAARLLQVVRAERDFRERILGGSPNGVVALDAQRRVVWINQAGRRLLKLEGELGDPIERYLSKPSFLTGLARVLQSVEELTTDEVSLGTGLDARHVHVSTFRTGEGDVAGVTLILQDLTERKRLDAQIQRMGRLASIGQLAAGVAHEIRNPLTGLAISIDILREEEALSDAGRGLLADMGREIDRLESLIRGMLDFARPRPVEPRPMRAAKALEWHGTFREQCRKKGVRFRFELRQNPKLQADPEKLKQLFLNLALNALEATDAGGEILIAAELARSRGQPWARFTVEDTGRGMGPEVLAQLFNPFFTTKSEGTGLGLAISHSVVEQHGGRIDVQSEPGAGTRFVVELPALEARE